MPFRVLNCSSPLGDDVFALNEFSGGEGLSQLFEYELKLTSLDDAIQPADVIGKPMGFSVRTEGLGERAFHGRVRSFHAGPIDSGGQREYRAVLVPWLWLLSRRSNCRIFQNKNAIDIAKEIFGELGFAGDFRSAVNQPPPQLEYCVQYRESDLNFISRLFEEFGLFYFFEHSADKHVLVLADAKSAYFDCDESSVQYSPGSLIENHVQRWERAFEFTSGKWTVRDYDFVKSKTKLESEIETIVEFENITKYEVYDYPGRYLEKPQGDAKVKAYIAGEEVGHDLAHGDSGCVSFTPGGKFKLQKHDAATENRAWVITAIRHIANEPSVRGLVDAPAYHNSFTCMAADALFRPPFVARRPVISGLQTAVVVGPSGEEIHTDAHGRVRVQFHWDRKGQKNENSSCWIRVSEPFAGKNFGAFHLPRIGQEVVVSFLEGDPDRPLVIGSVYNDDQPPPFPLPANKTQTGIRTRSSQGGGADNCNELRFEDKKGAEQLFLHAEKDELHEVENDQTLTVGHDQSITVENDCAEDIKHDRTLHVGNNQTDTVDKNRTISIGGDHDETIEKSMSLSVTNDRSMSVGKNLTEDITENMSVSVGKDSTTSISGAMTLEVTKDVTVTVSGKQTETITKELSVSAKKIQINGQDEISLVCGSAKIVLKKSGDIAIEGAKIKIKGSGDVIIKGSKVAQN